MRLGTGFGPCVIRPAARFLSIPTTPVEPEVVANFVNDTYTLNGASVPMSTIFEEHPFSAMPVPPVEPGSGITISTLGDYAQFMLAMKGEAAAPFLENGYIVLAAISLEPAADDSQVTLQLYNQFEDADAAAYWQAGCISFGVPGMEVNFGLLADSEDLFDQITIDETGPAFRFGARFSPNGDMRLSINGVETAGAASTVPLADLTRIAFVTEVDATAGGDNAGSATLKFIAIYPVDAYSDAELDDLTSLA